jgi:hypothetical protein
MNRICFGSMLRPARGFLTGFQDLQDEQDLFWAPCSAWSEFAADHVNPGNPAILSKKDYRTRMM